ncbi:hypothetical protein Y032_0426g1250 [Ancylostoma ceylanicum]|uniref:Reverse transcriptase domain-containing protein n=1 Tax=Ancylostoma ceylanicum TaxID=53326 RepID=A0A016X0U9_9BILA|nr:hypothetical protein Y032_0426g1250 [Ancylostoma ceylanicum]
MLRFIVGKIAIISDVEKAFLQVRLQERDRDATRCLWLRDHRSPPSEQNIRVLRFTRVTFGLLSSPFLLAATIHYHLDQYEEDTTLVKEIKENLYVDNLLLTADTVDDAITVYMRTKEIFNALKMNLREFVSNEQNLMSTIDGQDKSTEVIPKVLGIRWNSISDEIHISCAISAQEQVTKRKIASSIASIYDSMGWMVPLFHKAKLFLQSLWKAQLEWDDRLTETQQLEWEKICADMAGFEKSIPRFLAQKFSNGILITFTDASSEAMAACVYLRSKNAVNLLMAKGKLPPLDSKMTVPKLELNALTLGMRLTNSVISQLSSTVKISRVLILSDSEIALNWIKSLLRSDVGPFVKNRVWEVRKITTSLEKSGYEVEFGHISSQWNPADCATRGVDKRCQPISGGTGLLSYRGHQIIGKRCTNRFLLKLR